MVKRKSTKKATAKKSGPKKKKPARKTNAATAIPAGVPAVEELLALWRRTREPRVADVLAAIGRLSPHVKAPRIRDEKKWRAWATSRTDAELMALLAATPADRVDVLDRFGPDPRIGRSLVELIASYRPWSGTERYQVHIVAMCDRFAMHADRDIVERLARMVRVQVENTGYITSSAWFDREISAFVERLRGDVPASTADAALLAKCDGWLAAFRPPPQGARAELFEAVYAVPDDDGPRIVLADVLQQQKATPHGELIALQLALPTPEIEKRIATLLRNRAPACCSSLVWKSLWIKSVRFERGFIASGRLAPHSEKDFKAGLGAIEWATVHTLDPGNFASFGSDSTARLRTLEFLTHPAMKHLRRVGPISVQELVVLVQYGVPLPWKSIAIHSRDDDVALPGEEAARIFPNLQCLLVDLPSSTQAQLSARAWLKKIELRIADERPELSDLYSLPR